MTVTPKLPHDWLALFRQQINEIFHHLSFLEAGGNAADREYIPAVDIYETAERLVVEVELPGFSPEDISLSICCTVLVVEGTKKQDYQCRAGAVLCMERNFGRFRRAVEIPQGFDTNGVSAHYARGILSVAFPRLGGDGDLIREIPIAQGDSNGN
jgi:HSP20 family protein